MSGDEAGIYVMSAVFVVFGLVLAFNPWNVVGLLAERVAASYHGGNARTERFIYRFYRAMSVWCFGLAIAVPFLFD